MTTTTRPTHRPRAAAAIPGVAVSFLLLLAAAGPAAAQNKRIAFTFDDAPRAADRLLDVETRTRTLLASLEAAGVEGAMFFVTTNHIRARGDEGADRLNLYAAAGHTLANHSHLHGSANRMSATDFLADVSRAQQRLAAFPNTQPYFRFPYLHEGDTRAKRDTIRRGLADRGLRAGYVTVDNYDWYLQSLFSEAVASGRPLDLGAWRSVYVEVLTAAVHHYDGLATSRLGRSPAHVLLLHENDLAALFVDDLAQSLRAEGWAIVPALEAYRDPIASEAPDTLLLGQGRVAALADVAGEPRDNLFHPWESEAALRALLVERGLLDTAPGAYMDQPPPGTTPQLFAPGILTRDDRYEFGVAISADGREIFFGVSRENFRGEILWTRHTDGAWTEPVPLLSHPTITYADPHLSRDGSRLYFISSQPLEGDEASETRDLWFVRRTRDGWSEPEHLGDTINSEADEFYASFADDGTLAFASNRNAQREGDFDIFLAARAGEGFEPPQPLAGRANTNAYEADPFLAPDGSYVLFSSTRRRGQRRDLFVSFRQPDDTWSSAVSLGERINTAGIEFCPFVSRDGRFLFYTSNEDLYWVDAAVIDLAREQLPSGER